ncbi:O-antigen ligase family protein [Sulfuricurvum sp.]|uniref:O-antigen ligase family protein n=1 Tax=Sulfuricurvum sp. TaxID=2025608 RepID=UPI0026368DA0|nr:O-antigen ligase family protein [Sulfuricurvum sp.]MDD2266024.1 O-antigen ligase family protein [Sulfuricurvum sp.]MDD2783036.1 O-antigen ligase family protein [Sulfuricurvum sp.]
MNSYNRIFYYSTLLFAFTLPLSRAAVSFFVIWFILLFVAGKNYRSGWKILKSSRAVQVMGLFIAFMFASALWSSDTAEALKQIRLYSYWIVIPILAVSLKKEWLPRIITAFLGGMFISEILAYGIFFELWTINGRSPNYPSPFMSHIHYSVFLATTSILLLSRLLSVRYTWRSKLPMFLFFLTSTGNLMLSTGRTGQLAFLVTMVVAVIFHFRLTLKSFLLFATLSTLVFAGAYTSLDLFQKRFDMGVNDVRQLQEGNFDTSWGLRGAFWVITYDILKKHPLLGEGIGDYKHAAAKALAANDHGFSPSTIEWCSTIHYHNQYLMILAQGGLIGFALMVWLLIELFRLNIKDREIKEFSVLGLSLFTVACVAEPLWILQFPIILFIFITSLSLSATLSKSPE